MQARILNDYVHEGDDAEPVEPGTVVEVIDTIEMAWGNENDPANGLAICYAHPKTGALWISFNGAYEIIDE